MKFIMGGILLIIFGFSAFFLNGVFSQIFSGFTAPESKFVLYLMIPILGIYLIWNIMTSD